MVQITAAGVQAALHELHGTPAGAGLIAASLIVAALLVLRAVLAVLHFLWVYALRPGKDVKSFGEWAVVTGATDGIGRAYCEELARKGERRQERARTLRLLAKVVLERSVTDLLPYTISWRCSS